MEPNEAAESATGESTWTAYVEKSKNSPPRPLLVETMAYINGPRNEALDLGAGALNDTKFLLSQNFKHVTAVDRENLASKILAGLPKDKVDYIVSTFENYPFPPDHFDLINASFSLPFNPPTTFPEVFDKVKKALKPGGIFLGQLFGLNDDWNKENTNGDMPFSRENVSFFSKKQVEAFLADLEIIKLEEIEHDFEAPIGGLKHWDSFHIIARKKTKN